MATRQSMTAAELMQTLNADPEWVAKHSDREAAQTAIQEQFSAEEQALKNDLVAVGFEVSSVWDFVNTKDRYLRAIPVLIKHLSKPYHPRIREGLIRALTTQDSQGLINELIFVELQNEQNGEVRWALANALTVVAQSTDVDKIKALLIDPGNNDIAERLETALRIISINQKRKLR